ncbi:hypothetical protein [Halomonas sp. 3H]|uniref:hypothetical protein n=1 Tax=Halomonas sp. 3H TaxID=2952527 RepID=UPI0020B763E7|nr:hypothetical protein [Halomonas sp. 3H]
MAFAYVLVSFSASVVKSPNFSALADKVANGEVSFLPVTVISAILLFILREILEAIKKKRESKRKLFAYKSLLAEELELNLWAQRQLLGIINEIEEQEKDHPDAKYTLVIKETGKEYIQGRDGDQFIFGCPIPPVQDKYYEVFISNIAELDEKLFDLAQSSYEEVRNMAHVRNGLIEGLLADQNDEPYPHDIRKSGFFHYAKNELPDTFDAMNALYVECTGKQLKNFRLR